MTVETNSTYRELWNVDMMQECIALAGKPDKSSESGQTITLNHASNKTANNHGNGDITK